MSTTGDRYIIEFRTDADWEWRPIASQEGLNQSGLSEADASTWESEDLAEAALADMRRNGVIYPDDVAEVAP